MSGTIYHVTKNIKVNIINSFHRSQTKYTIQNIIKQQKTITTLFYCWHWAKVWYMPFPSRCFHSTSNSTNRMLLRYCEHVCNTYYIEKLRNDTCTLVPWTEKFICKEEHFTRWVASEPYNFRSRVNYYFIYPVTQYLPSIFSRHLRNLH